MKTKIVSAILVTLSLSALGAAVASAETQAATSSTAATPQDKKVMASEPHYVLATAYHECMLTFANALHGQTVNGGLVNVEFARDAVGEMRRDFDQMKKYNEKYMATISAEVRAKTTATMQELETHRADLNAQLTALEAEVKLDKPDAKKIATLAASVQTHLDAMSLVSQSGQPTGMMKY
jgi:hypothetical protein